MIARAVGTIIVAAAIAVITGGFLLEVVHAQRNQPVYPAYEGFLQNPDGSFTIAFAYFSHNAEVVTIEPGEHNVFAPAPGDRMQPITFKPGHWRFQCIMVVGPDFDGKLVWTLSYAGTTTGTSQRMMQSNWNLVEGASDLAKVDYANAPRGVCLNQAPSVRVLGLTRGERGAPPALAYPARVSEKLPLFGSVHDEGLPRGGTVTTRWRQVSGPGTVTFEDASSARTRATFSAPGSYQLELSATDTELSAEAQVTVSVGAGQ